MNNLPAFFPSFPWLRKRSLSSAALLAAGLLAVQTAEARPGRFARGGYHPEAYLDVHVGGNHLFFHNGYFYHRRHHAYYLAPPPIGIVVPFLPLDALVLHSGGLTLYYYGGNYYQESGDGYVVVAKPETDLVVDTVVEEDTTTSTAPAAPQTKTVLVNNSNGSHTPVLLEYVDGKWKGPRGEEYDAFPTNDQLRQAYGF